MVTGIEVSPDVVPRTFAQALDVDVSNGPETIIVRVAATDDLSGVSSTGLNLIGPGSQGPGLDPDECTLTQGTPLAGSWECPITVPRFAETGDWPIRRLGISDRVGNRLFYFRLPTDGRLCLSFSGEECLTNLPVVTVTSPGDTEAPALQALNLSVVDVDLTTSLSATDDLSGIKILIAEFESARSGQRISCVILDNAAVDGNQGGLVAGTPTDGTWDCTASFPEFSAEGSWFLEFLALGDEVGNVRRYLRRAADGFLCDLDGGVCTDFGNTEGVLVGGS